MNRIALLGLAASAALAFGLPAGAKPITFELPPETAELKPGPNLETAQGNCVACHSADYILTQPRSMANKKEFWLGEVNKMIHSYGAPIQESDVAKIVEYLAATY
ncbi:MAG: cytochrome c [Alphaproteobacteria bacterium]|nr:cytochrome c [Alphaproteobacteria bacterium]